MRPIIACLPALVLGCTCEPKPNPSAQPEIVVPPPQPRAPASTASPSAGAATSASASASAPAAAPAEPAPYPERTTTKWPLDMGGCSATPCKLSDGTPGLTCVPGQACFNPCLPGMGPEPGRWTCAKLCKTNADCGKDGCVNGLCDRWPKHGCKDPQDNCTTKDGEIGFRCSPRHECKSMCKRGLAVYGGTHCAKPCKSDADCPRGSCSEEFCVPLCPSEGCPYLWE